MENGLSHSENATESIKVLIVDDLKEWRDILYQIINSEADIRAIGSAASEEEALAQVSLLQPDVVLIDIRLIDHESSSMHGLSAANIIRMRFPAVHVVILSAYAYLVMRKAFQMGIYHVLDKGDFDSYELKKAIREAHQNRTP